MGLVGTVWLSSSMVYLGTLSNPVSMAVPVIPDGVIFPVESEY